MLRHLLVAIMLAALATPGPSHLSRVAWAQEAPAQPLTLDDCIAIALANNPQIVSSRQAIVSAKAGLTGARSGYYPQLSLSAVEGFTSRTSFITVGGTRVAVAGSDTRQELDLTLRATLWRYGRSENVEERKALLTAAELNHTSTVQSLVEQVAQHYYGLLAAGEMVAVAAEGVTSAEGHLEQVKARVALGAAAEVDVLPVEDDLARAQLDLIEARGGVRLTRVQLRNVMGLPAEVSPQLASASAPTRQQLPPLQDALATGIANRPEVAAGEAYVRANRYGLKQAKISRGPSIDLGGQYNRGYTDWEENEPSWNLLLSLSWPLFDGHAGEADEASANASLVRAEADLDRLAKQVVLDVESALIAADNSAERLEASAKSVAVAESRLAAAEAMYQQGLAILLEVIDARASVTSARAAQVRAGFDYQVALVALSKAMGTLSPPETAVAESELRAGD